MDIKASWKDNFTDREKKLINNCTVYKQSDPAGLPGHNLALIVAKMTEMLDSVEAYFDHMNAVD